MRPHEDPDQIRIPSALSGKVHQLCKEQQVSPEQLIEYLLEQWIAKGAPSPFDDDIEHDAETNFFLATRLFLETLPLETTIKTVEDGEVRYLWANALFRNMAGGLELKDIAHRSNREVWKHDPERAARVEKWDRELLANNGESVIHTDIVFHEPSMPRHRMGIRFRSAFQKATSR